MARLAPPPQRADRQHDEYAENPADDFAAMATGTKMRGDVERRQHAVTQFGVTRQDPYAWLRAENWQEVMQSPETLPAAIRAYLEAENAYFAEAFETPHAELTEQLYREIRGRIKEDDSGVASADGPWAYNSRMLEGQQYPLIVRTPRHGGEETILLDCNAEAGESYFGFAAAEHSPDHRLLAWAADRQGSEFYTIHIRDIATGKDTAEVITETAGDPVWSPDGTALVYTAVLQPAAADNGVWYVQMDGTGRRKLPIAGGYRWLPDGSGLVYIPAPSDLPTDELRAFSLVDGTTRTLVTAQQARFLVASDDWELAPDGRTIVFRSGEDGAIWVLAFGR